MEEQPFSRRAARLSWIAPLVSMGLGLLLSPLLPTLGSAGPLLLALAGLLVPLGLVLGIAALFGLRRHGAEGILGPALAGLALNLLLLFAGIAGVLQESRRREEQQQALAQQVTTNSPAEATTPILDEDYRFRIAWPGEGWKLLHEAEVKKLNADAVAGGVFGGTIFAVVIIERTVAGPLETWARVLIDNMPLEEKKVDLFEELTFRDLPAIRYRVSGRLKGVPLRYENVVFARAVYGYQLLGWGIAERVDDRGECFRPFQEAFSLTEGEVRGRVFTPPLRDQLGVGWRIKDGAFESAAQRLAVTPPPGWRLIVGRELSQHVNQDAEVALVYPDPEIYITLIPDRIPGFDPEAHAAALQEQMARNLGAPPLPEPWKTSVDGEEISFQRYRRAEPLPLDYLYGLRFEGEVCWQIVVWHIPDVRAEAERLIPEGLAAIRFLDEPSAAALNGALAAAPVPHSVVGETFSLRRGLYRDFQYGFAWRAPAGFWRVSAGEEARARDEEALLWFEEPSLGIYGKLSVSPTEQSPGLAHRLALEETFPEQSPAFRKIPEELSLGGQPALSSEAEVEDGYKRFRFRVTTVVRDGRVYRLTLWGATKAMQDEAAQVQAALRGLSFPEGMAATSEAGGVFSDARLGFSFRPPGPGWKHLDETPPQLRPLGSIHSWKAEGQSAVVLALNTLDPEQDEAWFMDFLEQTMRGLFAKLSSDAPERGEATLAGLPCRSLSWKGRRGEAAAFLLMRDRSFYALLISDDWKPLGADRDRLRAGFALID